MKPLPHEYDVTLQGTPVGYATLSADALPDLAAAPPREYDGPGDAWSPEHLLLASVSACFLFTFRAVAKASKIDFLDLKIHTSGTVARDAGVTRFTDIAVRVAVTPCDTDIERLHLALEKTKSRCLVSSSLQTPVRVEATVNELREKCA
jgi:organic hydroperoxide reductase OsmC/OhrA